MPPPAFRIHGIVRAAAGERQGRRSPTRCACASTGYPRKPAATGTETMSYDLYFFRRDGSMIPKSGFDAYFSGRQHYGQNGDPGFYGNDDTGVYFSFAYADDRDEEDDPDWRPAAATFNINYVRPHIFALEAEPELAAFARHFDLTVDDPQISGMGKGEYSGEGFLTGWNAGNDFAHRAFAGQAGASFAPYVLPAERIEACWRWNHERHRLQQRFGEAVFVPRIMFLAHAGKPLSVCVWPDGIPIALPLVDAIIVDRDALAPRRFFGRSKDRCLAMWAEVVPVLEQVPAAGNDYSYCLLCYEAPPPAVVAFVRSLRPLSEQPTLIAVDKILDAELVQKAVDAPAKAITTPLGLR